MNFREIFMIFCLGFSCGAGAMWWHFSRSRLIRTQHEWYSDPVIASTYPDQADEALSKPDSW